MGNPSVHNICLPLSFPSRCTQLLGLQPHTIQYLWYWIDVAIDWVCCQKTTNTWAYLWQLLVEQIRPQSSSGSSEKKGPMKVVTFTSMPRDCIVTCSRKWWHLYQYFLGVLSLVSDSVDTCTRMPEDCIVTYFTYSWHLYQEAWGLYYYLLQRGLILVPGCLRNVL